MPFEHLGHLAWVYWAKFHFGTWEKCGFKRETTGLESVQTLGYSGILRRMSSRAWSRVAPRSTDCSKGV